MTETSPSTHCNPVTGQRRAGSIGLPLPGTHCKVVARDDPTVEVPVGEAGELAIAGPQVFRGYWGRDDVEGVFTEDGYVLTGDVAVMDEDGFFTVVDRKKELIIAGGFNVYPSEVEEVLFRAARRRGLRRRRRPRPLPRRDGQGVRRGRTRRHRDRAGRRRALRPRADAVQGAEGRRAARVPAAHRGRQGAAPGARRAGARQGRRRGAAGVGPGRCPAGQPSGAGRQRRARGDDRGAQGRDACDARGAGRLPATGRRRHRRRRGRQRADAPQARAGEGPREEDSPRRPPRRRPRCEEEAPAEKAPRRRPPRRRPPLPRRPRPLRGRAAPPTSVPPRHDPHPRRRQLRQLRVQPGPVPRPARRGDGRAAQRRGGDRRRRRASTACCCRRARARRSRPG